MSKKDTLHRHRIQKFVKTTIEIRKKPEHRPDPLPSVTKERNRKQLITRNDLPLFMEPRFRVKEHDPL